MTTGNLDPIVVQLAARRRQLGMPASQLALECGFASTQIAAYESGARSPDVPRLRRWARGLGMAINIAEEA